MKHYVLLTCIGMSGFIVEASQAPAPKRNLKTAAEVGYVQDLVKNRGPQAFVDALTAMEFDVGIFEMPLGDFKVEVEGGESSLAAILLGLNNMDDTFKLIQDAFFTKKHGLDYLNERLAALPDLAAANTFLQQYPWALYYVNPFNVQMQTGPFSLGYYVEIGLLGQDASAVDIKALYRYGNRWDNEFKRGMKDEEKDILESEQITTTLVNLYGQAGIAGVIKALEQDPLKATVQKLNLFAITVKGKDGAIPLITLIKEECRKGDEIARKVYASYFLAHFQLFDQLLAAAYESKNYEKVADEIVCCPVLARRLFRPEIMLDLQVDELAEKADPHALAIKAAVSPDTWNENKERYKEARHLRTCWNKGTLDDEGKRILAQVGHNKIVANYVTRLKASLPKQITAALKEQTVSKIDMVESWLDGFSQAGIDFDTGETVAQAQDKLKQRRIAIAGLRSGKNGGGTPPAKTSWLTPTKLFLIGVGCVVAYVAFDQLKKYSDEDQPAHRPDRPHDLIVAH